MQSVSSRIWTRVAVSISYDDDDYTTGTTLKIKVSYLSEVKVIACLDLELIYRDVVVQAVSHNDKVGNSPLLRR